jgi:hypothetical protein
MPARINLAFLVTNIVGAVVYVIRSSPGWAIPQEREPGLDLTTGEPFIRAVIIVRSKHWRDTWLWAVTACVWLVGTVVDFAHH